MAMFVSGVNDLATKFPDLVKEWDYKKNGDLKPWMISSGYPSKIWWICKKGHSYQSLVSNRSKGTSCPYCSNRKVLKGYNDFETICPDISKEWDYIKNGNFLPSDFVYGSPKKFWWICSFCGYSWKTEIRNRYKGFGCPKCAHAVLGRLNSKNGLIEGKNDLETLFPDIALDWDYFKNGYLLPSQFKTNSNFKASWICHLCGYEWDAIIYSRVNGNGCPSCSFYYGTSFCEQAVYYFLKLYFGNTDVLNRYKFKDGKKSIEIDVFIPKYKIGVEYDGYYWHYNRKKQDLYKEKYLKKFGIKLYRIIESDVYKIEGNYIFYKYDSSKNFKNLSLAIKDLLFLLGFGSLFVDVQLNEIDIKSDLFKFKLENSMFLKYPELAKEFDVNNNYGLLPENVPANSTARFNWKCSKCGYLWSAKFSERRNGTGCPACAGHICVPGVNDLATKFPDLVKEWDYYANGDLSPSSIAYASNTMVFWICSKYGHKWSDTVNHRTSGRGCPYCSHHRVLSGFNDLLSQFPDTCKDWDYLLNDKKPSEVFPFSDKEAWWKCDICGNSYLCKIKYHTKGSRCPVCTGKMKNIKK